MRTRLVTVLLSVIAAIMVIPGIAAADAAGGESLKGQIRAPGSSDEGVEGIDIAVSQDGDEIGTATTDTDGEWEVEVPEAGDYHVVLDQESIPDEYEQLESTGPDRYRGTINVGVGSIKGTFQGDVELTDLQQPKSS